MRYTQFYNEVIKLRDQITESEDPLTINKLEKQILELKVNFNKKKSIDKRYDKLLKEYNNVDY